MEGKSPLSWLHATPTQVYHPHNTRNKWSSKCLSLPIFRVYAKRQRWDTWCVRCRQCSHTRLLVWGHEGRNSQTSWGSCILLEHHSLCRLPPCAHLLPFLPVPRRLTEPLPEVLDWCGHRASYFLPLMGVWAPHRVAGGGRGESCCWCNAHACGYWCVQ